MTEHFQCPVCESDWGADRKAAWDCCAAAKAEIAERRAIYFQEISSPQAAGAGRRQFSAGDWVVVIIVGTILALWVHVAGRAALDWFLR